MFGVLTSVSALHLMVIAITIQVFLVKGRNHRESLPPLRLHVSLKRKSSHIHGHSEFDIFVNPVVFSNGTAVLYDGYAEFTDNDTVLKYSFVNGSGYISRGVGDEQNVQCIPSDTFLINSILPALNDATPIPSASIGNEEVQCTSGKLFKTTISGALFAICASGVTGFTVYNSDMMVKVEYRVNPVEIQKPRNGLFCDSEATPTSVSPTTLALLTGSVVPADTKRQLKPAEHMFMDASSCNCKSTPRPCVFFHGSGSSNEMEELQDTPNAQMGNMNTHAPCCTEVKYAVLNTVDYSWTDDSIQQKVCHRALRLSESSDVKEGVIKDTIVVTHSMGGLVLSMALATGKCSFGDGVSWVAISSPMTGSMAADFLQGYCNDENTPIMNSLMELLGKCPMPISRQNIMYENGEYASDQLNTAYAVAQEAYRGNVSAAMCSSSYAGIFSKYQAVLYLGGSVLPHKSPENDGLVEFQSCAVGLDEPQFGTSYKDKFYKPKLNHADTAFLDGDGLIWDSQKPVKWFECLL